MQLKDEVPSRNGYHASRNWPNAEIRHLVAVICIDYAIPATKPFP